jgi:hypothetical protein
VKCLRPVVLVLDMCYFYIMEYTLITYVIDCVKFLVACWLAAINNNSVRQQRASNCFRQ